MAPSYEVTEEGLGDHLLGLELPWSVHMSDGHLSIINRFPGPIVASKWEGTTKL